MISAQKIAATAGDSKTQVVPVSGGKLDLLSLWVELRDAQTLDSVGYLQLHCQYVWSAIRSNPFGTFATVLLIALAVFLSGTVLVIGKPTSALLFAESARLPIKVLFEPEGKEEIGKILREQPSVESLKFISGEIALAALKERLGPEHPLFDGLVNTNTVSGDSGKSASGGSAEPSRSVADSILPARYLVSLKPGFHKEEIAPQLEIALSGIPTVKRITYQSELVSNLRSMTTLLSRIGSLFSFSLFIGAMLLVVIVVQLRFLLRAREVGVMKLVGATRPFIVFPLYLEGLFTTLVGILLAFGMLSIFEQALFEQVSAFFPSGAIRAELFSIDPVMKMALGLAAVTVTMLGACAAIFLFQTER